MNKLKRESTPSFMTNVAIILFAQIMVKILGMVYRIVITNIENFGDAGNGFYNAGFQVYTVLLAISSVGIPNAIAKMVSERTALGDYKGAHTIFKTAFMLFGVIGAVCTAILYFGSEFIAFNIIGMDGTQYVMRALAPSIFFVCISSVIRGYFQGLNNMHATSNSQMFEQVFKCLLTIVLVVLTVDGMPQIMSFFSKIALLYNDDVTKSAPELMAAWANAATSLATFISFVYLAVFYIKRKCGIMEQVRKTAVESLKNSTGSIIKSILMLSIPISLASIITAINRVIDLATITNGIEIAFAELIPAYGNTAAIVNPTAKQLSAEAVRLSGMLSKSDVLINMPLALNVAFATVLVPSISGALAVGDKKEASGKIRYSFLISTLLILPCCVGYIILAQPIYKIIYRNAALGYELLAMMSISLLFSALTQTITGALQGLGKVFVPALSILAGCVIKIALNIILIRQPQINIYGAAISSIACQITAFVINFVVLSKYITFKLSLNKYIIKPLLANVLMGIVTYFVYKLSMLLININLIATALSIICSVVVYAFAVLKFRILSEDEIKAFPAGNKLYSLLVKLKLYK
ncbi:MAG: polysaccharide biosynthesis protein [Clostridia bacterium]|nr:polysaccharide biosynthesis protein [Clostridia bacterium]